ncbi:zona pellucida sperm-binding protein 3-like [Osmerus mordax]|uniref:zona pellucida sperm-binding protein 3-like n=1 Tax=Osmerus mordax TaxID=8014 RepID=UPI00350EF3A5
MWVEVHLVELVLFLSLIRVGSNYDRKQPALESHWATTAPVKLHMPPTAEEREPVPANSVEVECGEALVRVVAQQDFLGTGQLIDPADLTLGGCPLKAFDKEKKMLLFEAELQECDSLLMAYEDVLVYTFRLAYAPMPIKGTSIVRGNSAEVSIQCYYQRHLNVSSKGLDPTWIPFVASTVVEQQLLFSLHLMTDDWQARRSSGHYFLGDFINIEASVHQANHAPLRIFIDRCVATLSMDVNSEPRYSFIQNNGCLMDGDMTGSKSHFLQTTSPERLQLALEAFKFHLDDRSSIYITCHLKARSAFIPNDSENKACSFDSRAVRWRPSEGSSDVCDCCEKTCVHQRRKMRSLTSDTDHLWERDEVLGPILIQSRVQEEGLPEFPAEQAELQVVEDQASEGMSWLLVVLAGVCTTVVWLAVMGTVLYLRLRHNLLSSACSKDKPIPA